MQNVYICGSGLINSLGYNEKQFFDKLSKGLTGIRKVKEFDTSSLYSNISGEIDRQELFNTLKKRYSSKLLNKKLNDILKLLDNKKITFEAFLLSLAILDALSENPHLSLLDHTVPIIIGSTKLEITELEDFVKKGESYKVIAHLFSPFKRALKSIIPNSDITHINNACASSLIAIIRGVMLIKSGIYETVICGGIDLITLFTFSGFAALKALSPMQTRPFDAERNGLNPGSAAGCVIITSKKDKALSYNKNLIQIAGYGISNDAYHVTHPDPNGIGLKIAMEQALQNASMKPKDINYINAHGTGTKFNEIMENSAISKIFSSQVPVSSIKGATGHTMGASGIIEVIAIIRMMSLGIIPNINMINPDPEFSINLIKEQQPAPTNVMKCNSGFGGINSAIILKREK